MFSSTPERREGPCTDSDLVKQPDEGVEATYLVDLRHDFETIRSKMGRTPRLLIEGT